MFGIILGLFGVAMDRHGLILRENEATGSRKVSKYLPGLRDAIEKSKLAAKVKNTVNFNVIYVEWGIQKSRKFRICLANGGYKLPINRPSGRYALKVFEINHISLAQNSGVCSSKIV